MWRMATRLDTAALDVPVTKFRTDHVGKHEETCKDPLSEDYRASKERSRLFELKKSHQMYPFIFSLFLELKKNNRAFLRSALQWHMQYIRL
jgi:hypothetical protein